MDREERIRWLNERLPRKRAIGHALIRSTSGKVLLCGLTYKTAWDLPGGVVEPHESPRAGCAREVREELGVDLEPRGLLAVNWLPPWSGWDDATTFLFDLGVHDESFVDGLHLETREIASVAWCDPDAVRERAADATARLLAAVGDRDPADGPVYLEDAHTV